MRVRNQSGGDAGPWNVGNTAHFTGTIDTEYVDGSTIQFLAGQTNVLGVNSGSYRPKPSDYTGGTINPDGTASGGDFTGTATARESTGTLSRDRQYFRPSRHGRCCLRVLL